MCKFVQNWWMGTCHKCKGQGGQQDQQQLWNITVLGLDTKHNINFSISVVLIRTEIHYGQFFGTLCCLLFFVRGVSLLFIFGMNMLTWCCAIMLIFERILWFIFNRNLVMFLVRSTQPHSNYFYLSFLWFAIQKRNLRKTNFFTHICMHNRVIFMIQVSSWETSWSWE